MDPFMFMFYVLCHKLFVHKVQNCKCPKMQYIGHYVFWFINQQDSLTNMFADVEEKKK